MCGVPAHVHMWGSGIDMNHFPLFIFQRQFLTELEFALSDILPGPGTCHILPPALRLQVCGQA